MTQILDFGECLKDSPKFRADLEDKEHALHELESHLEKLVKISHHAVESGKSYSHSIGSLMNSFENLSKLFYTDVFVSTALKKINNLMNELQTFLMVFLEQAQKSITISLNHFVKEDIRKVKDTKKVFDKISDDLDNALNKNSQLLKNCRSGDAEEAKNILIATKSCFHHTALDYTFLINNLQSKQRFQILSQIVMFINGCSTYHQQSHQVLSNFEEYQKGLSTQLEDLQTEFLSDQKEMEERHTLVQEKNLQYENILNQTLPRNKNIVIMDGYLFKRASNAFKTWNRRWFVIQNNKLYYTKRSKSEGATEMVDLRLSTVKNAVDVDRRFSFAVVCPTKCWYLQSDDEKSKDRWMKVMQMAIARAINDPESSDDIPDNSSMEKLHPQFLLSQLRDLPGNDVCVDCSCSNPKWASINLGIIVCIGCSGIHRSLGVHISKVRSITLDDWDTESIKLMLELGNEVVNEIYEAVIPPEWSKPTPASDRPAKEEWIKAKYVEKKFINRVNSGLSQLSTLKRKNVVKRAANGQLRAFSLENRVDVLEGSISDKRVSVSSIESIEFDDGQETSPNLHPDMLLYQAAKGKSLSMMTLAFANGADVNQRNHEAEEKTPLHESVIAGSVSASEYLLQNGAIVNTQDALGRSPLHYAALHGSTGHTCLFLKRDADQKMQDNSKKDPLMIALQNTHADIVTLLRLARLHEEIKETDISMGGDETVNDVFRDFSNLASEHPEKLTRDRQTYI